MDSEKTAAVIAALPKAELHLHLEGSIEPSTVVELAARHRTTLTVEEAAAHYQFDDFQGFLEAFKWVTSFLRTPRDYALITERLADQLISQNVAYAEVTVSIGVMLRRKQDALANFLAVAEAGSRAQHKGLQLHWIFDAVRQFGPDAAMEVARLAVQMMKSQGIVAFGMGGDELALPAKEFRDVYEYAANHGLYRLVHAGEIGGPESVREAIDTLGAERIGHGIAAMHDPLVMEHLQVLSVPLEICPISNLKTGALARQLGRGDVRIDDHPVKMFRERGLLFTISTDDPAMFRTTLNEEYASLLRLGFSLEDLAAMSVRTIFLSFLPEAEKLRMAFGFDRRIRSLNLL